MVSIYTYYIDRPRPWVFNAAMKKTSCPPFRLTRDYRQLRRQLSQLGYLSQGSVFERAPGQQGSRYVWTRKLKAKTITVALSEKQYHWLGQAVANQRELQHIVSQMQTLSRQILFTTIPGVLRRKPLGKKALGLI